MDFQIVFKFIIIHKIIRTFNGIRKAKINMISVCTGMSEMGNGSLNITSYLIDYSM